LKGLTHFGPPTKLGINTTAIPPYSLGDNGSKTIEYRSKINANEETLQTLNPCLFVVRFTKSSWSHMQVSYKNQVRVLEGIIILVYLHMLYDPNILKHDYDISNQIDSFC